MITINVTTQGELVARLERAPAKLRALVIEKMILALDAAYSKAVLQFSGGKYSSTPEVEHGVEQQGSLVIAYMEPVTTKAKVQEFGGRGYYQILPTKGNVLRFIGGKDGAVVLAKSVLHPPLPGKHYIEIALVEEATSLRDEFARLEIMR